MFMCEGEENLSFREKRKVFLALLSKENQDVEWGKPHPTHYTGGQARLRRINRWWHPCGSAGALRQAQGKLSPSPSPSFGLAREGEAPAEPFK